MTANEVAAAAGISAQGVRWKRKKGQTDEEIISGIAQRDAASNEVLSDALLRKERAMADRREIEVQQLLKELIPVLPAERIYAAVYGMVRTKFLNMPAAINDQCAAITDPKEMLSFLDAEIRSRLSKLSDEFQRAGESVVDGGGEGDTAAETPDGDGVGGGEPGTE